MISVRYSDISEKLSIPWGPGLVGKMTMVFPAGKTRYDSKIAYVDNNCVMSSDKAPIIMRNRYVGSRGPYAFFRNYDEADLIGKELVIDSAHQGKLTSIARGIYKTDKGLSFNAENYNVDFYGISIIKLKAREGID